MYLVFAHLCAVGLGGDCLSSNSSLTTILLSFFPPYSHPKRQVDNAPLFLNDGGLSYPSEDAL